ncbi:hypothetical protein [Streptomyces sp. NPDC037389]|uniref:hypothetical protein n=1 Tax=Streptomyces sp. NPDC037389 TaxID=3155369 RepID=UPI0033E92177
MTGGSSGWGTGIDELLADATVPAPPVTGFDTATALSRLAHDTSKPSPRRQVRDWQAREARTAQVALDWICRWSVNDTEARNRLSHFASGAGIEAEGAFAFACLLAVLGYPRSATFWWQLAAGADHRGAAYCLHLHHLQADVTHEASWYWYEQFATLPAEFSDDGVVHYELLAAESRYRRRHLPPGGGVPEPVVDEVHRLAAATLHSFGVVGRPGERLTQSLKAIL